MSDDPKVANRQECNSARSIVRYVRRPLAIALVAAAQAADGAEANNEYSVNSTLHYEYLRNPNRQMGRDDVHDQLRRYQIDTRLSRTTSRASTSFDYSLAKLDYEKGLLNDRTQVTGAGSILWAPVKDVFIWSLSNNRSLQSIDATLPATQNNLQVSELSETGPSLQLGLGAKSRATAKYSYALASTQSIVNSKQQRDTWSLNLQHQLTTKISTGLSYNAFEATLDSGLLRSFDRQTYALNGSYTSLKYQLNLSAGYVDSSSNLNSNYIDFDLNYIPIPNTSVNLSYGDSVEDLFSSLSANSPLGNIGGSGSTQPGSSPPASSTPTPSGPFTGDPIANAGSTALSATLLQQYKVQSTALTIAHQIPNSLNYAFEYSVRDREFTDGSDRQSEDRFGLIVGFALSDSLRLSVAGRDVDLDFGQTARLQNRRELMMSADWTLNSKMRLAFSFNTTKQTGNIPTDVFDAMNASVAFTYLITSRR